VGAQIRVVRNEWRLSSAELEVCEARRVYQRMSAEGVNPSNWLDVTTLIGG